MALTEGRLTKQRDGKDTPAPVAAATKLYTGGLACFNATGFAVPGADTAGLKFGGMILKDVDNSGGGDGDEKATLRRGVQVLMKGSGLSQANVGDRVCLVDDETVAPAGVTTNDIECGTLMEFVSATAGWVALD